MILVINVQHTHTSQSHFWYIVQWFDLNSLHSGPELISDTYLSLFLTQLQMEGIHMCSNLMLPASLVDFGHV